MAVMTIRNLVTQRIFGNQNFLNVRRAFPCEKQVGV